MSNYYEALFGQAIRGNISAGMNIDDFHRLASRKFQPESDISAVGKEADRLRSLARDIKELKDAGLI